MKIGTIIGIEPQHNILYYESPGEGSWAWEGGGLRTWTLLVIAHIPKYMSLIENYVDTSFKADKMYNWNKFDVY